MPWSRRNPSTTRTHRCPVGPPDRGRATTYPRPTRSIRSTRSSASTTTVPTPCRRRTTATIAGSHAHRAEGHADDPVAPLRRSGAPLRSVMGSLDLTADQLLSTTRAVRKRLDLTRPVERAILQECLDLAFQAPSGGDAQGWHFVLVSDAGQRAAIADLYRRSKAENDPPVTSPEQERMMRSSAYLAEHL